jgi:hypothetical protein
MPRLPLAAGRCLWSVGFTEIKMKSKKKKMCTILDMSVMIVVSSMSKVTNKQPYTRSQARGISNTRRSLSYRV